MSHHLPLAMTPSIANALRVTGAPQTLSYYIANAANSCTKPNAFTKPGLENLTGL
jgi:hypothetical protein